MSNITRAERLAAELDGEWKGVLFTTRQAAATELRRIPHLEAERDKLRAEVEALRAAPRAPLPGGWTFNHARRHPDPDQDGAWEIGFIDDEDDRFSPIITVDTGLYYQDDQAEPLARAILAKLTEPRHAPRAPLTDEQISAALAQVTHEVPCRLPPGWKKFARAIERAHGIGQQGGAA